MPPVKFVTRIHSLGPIRPPPSPLLTSKRVFTPRVSMEATFDGLLDTSTIGVFELTHTGQVSAKSNLQNYLFGSRVFLSRRCQGTPGSPPMGELHSVLPIWIPLSMSYWARPERVACGFHMAAGRRCGLQLASALVARVNLDFESTHFTWRSQDKAALASAWGGIEHRSAIKNPKAFITLWCGGQRLAKGVILVGNFKLDRDCRETVGYESSQFWVYRKKSPKTLPPRSLPSQTVLFSVVAYAPNCIRPIVAHQQRSIRRHRHSYRTSPGVSAIQHKSRQEVLILATGLPGLV
jgi:hypothetical protein